MCAIFGCSQVTLFEDPATVLQSCIDAMLHRGPDSSGVWIDQECGFGLAHRRLAIIDLSDQGHQPMHSDSGRYVISFNGEIYNFKHIRRKLNSIQDKQISWNGNSDTEVLVNAIELIGLKKTLEMISGMFAFALWDKQDKTLVLARDRMGEKPLYYGWMNGSFVFASEIKAIKTHPLFEEQINPVSVNAFVKFGYIPGTNSIYQDIHRLEPGCYLKLELAGDEISEQQVVRYWSLAELARNRQNPDSSDHSIEVAISSLDQNLREVISRQMISDVPLGAFLSGGVDSSLVVAIMQATSSESVKTFTIGFESKYHDEAIYAAEVARILGTDHSEYYITEQDALNIIPDLPSVYDEPFADPSQIPTILVSQLARQEVTVALSGDAGDELFGGYNRYIWINRIWRKTRWIPFSARQLISNLILGCPPARMEQLYEWVSRFIRSLQGTSDPVGKIRKVAEILKKRSLIAMFWSAASSGSFPSSIFHTDFEVSLPASFRDDSEFTAEDMMYLDSKTYLPDDILVKLDRAAMSTSLETRVPFLDPALVSFAWKSPLSMKIRDNEAKWMLKRLLSQYLPIEVIERPKAGFGVPMDEWLRGPLKEWGHDLLSDSALKRSDCFDAKLVKRLWHEHVGGERNWQHVLWNILMYQAWHEAQ